jgi:hypothetical protein
MATNCAPAVCEPERTQGIIAPAAAGTHVLVTLKGPGVFVGSECVKQGGQTNLTFVVLDIDGRNVTNISYAAAENGGLTQQNPFGLVLLHSTALRNLTIGFAAPLRERAQALSRRQRTGSGADTCECDPWQVGQRPQAPVRLARSTWGPAAYRLGPESFFSGNSVTST